MTRYISLSTGKRFTHSIVCLKDTCTSHRDPDSVVLDACVHVNFQFNLRPVMSVNWSLCNWRPDIWAFYSACVELDMFHLFVRGCWLLAEERHVSSCGTQGTVFLCCSSMSCDSQSATCPEACGGGRQGCAICPEACGGGWQGCATCEGFFVGLPQSLVVSGPPSHAEDVTGF